MKICIIAEGCYPYVVGGVSGWINNLICSFPRVSFSVLAIISDRSISKKFQYTLPENVTEVHEVYLNDCEWTGKGKSRKHCHLSAKEAAALKSLLLGKDTDWVTLTTLLQSRKFSLNALLMGPDFLDAVIECYEEKHSEIVFSLTFYGQCAPCTCRFFCHCSPIAKMQEFIPLCRNRLFRCAWQYGKNCCTRKVHCNLGTRHLYPENVRRNHQSFVDTGTV